jgi:hypothetical protein
MTVIEIHMKNETVRQILTNKFEYQTEQVGTDPKNLRSDRKLSRKDVCPEIAEKNDEDTNILNAVVTRDKTQLLQ